MSTRTHDPIDPRPADTATQSVLARSATDGSIARSARDRLDRRLFEELGRTGDRRVRERLIERFLPLAHSLARRYQDRGEPHDDLVQVAALGLTHAVDRFDPDRGASFSSFAVPTILGELRRHFRDRTWAVRPPRDLQELTLRVERSAEQLAVELGRAATVAQIAEAAGVDDERVLEALQAGRGYRASSLAQPVSDDAGAPTLQDSLSAADDDYERAEDRVVLQRLKTGLTARQTFVLTMRYEQDMTQAQIGDLLGVSQMQISRILRESMERMREMATRPSASTAPA